MTSAQEKVRAALTQMGEVRPDAKTDDEFARFAEDVRRRIAEGGELRVWNEAEKRFREIPDDDVCEAVRSIATNSPRELLSLFAAASNPLAVLTLSRWLPWTDDFAIDWVRESPTRALAALGIVKWLDRDVVDATRDFADRLKRIAIALEGRPRADEVSLWWQLLGIAHRVCSTRTQFLGELDALYRGAGTALARGGGGDALLDASVIDKLSETNRDLRAVLPYIAASAADEHVPRLLEAHFRDVERRLGGELHEIPYVDSPGGLLYLNACGRAIGLELLRNSPSRWWEATLRRYLSRQTGWHADLSGGGMDRPAWIAAATAVACIQLATEDTALWAPTAERLFALVDPYLEDWWWYLGYPSSSRLVLVELLVRVATLKGMDGAAERAARIGRAAPDGARLDAILAHAPAQILPDLERLRRQRAEYEQALAPEEDA